MAATDRARATRALLPSVFTIGIRSIEEYERRARELAHLPWLKIKVSDERPLEAIAALRRGAPSARLVVEPNQAWDLRMLDELAPRLADMRVDLLEQPVSISDGEQLVAGRCPVPVCADEAVDTVADLSRVRGRYDFVNIKLDKSGRTYGGTRSCTRRTRSRHASDGGLHERGVGRDGAGHGGRAAL